MCHCDIHGRKWSRRPDYPMSFTKMINTCYLFADEYDEYENCFRSYDNMLFRYKTMMKRCSLEELKGCIHIQLKMGNFVKSVDDLCAKFKVCISNNIVLKLFKHSAVYFIAVSCVSSFNDICTAWHKAGYYICHTQIFTPVCDPIR